MSWSGPGLKCKSQRGCPALCHAATCPARHCRYCSCCRHCRVSEQRRCPEKSAPCSPWIVAVAARTRGGECESRLHEIWCSAAGCWCRVPPAGCCSWELLSPQSAAPELGSTLVSSLCPSLISVCCVSKQHLLLCAGCCCSPPVMTDTSRDK